MGTGDPVASQSNRCRSSSALNSHVPMTSTAPSPHNPGGAATATPIERALVLRSACMPRG